MWRKRRIVMALAFVGHYPALWLLTRFRLSPQTKRLNARAITLTLVAMGAALEAYGRWAMVGTWLVGHVAWGTYLALRVMKSDGELV